MGSPAKDALAKNKLVPKNKTINSLRCTPIALPSGASCLLSYSASIEGVDYSSYIDLLTDVRLAMRKAQTGSFEAKVGAYRYVKDFGEAVENIRSIYSKTQNRVPVSMDLETLGRDSYDSKAYIISIQICYEAGKADVVYFSSRKECLSAINCKKFRGSLDYLLNNTDQVTLNGAGFKFDIGWLWSIWKVECTTFRFDTLLVGSLLDENRSNSLKVHAKIYVTEMGGYSDAFDKTYDKSRMDLVPKDDLLLYAGADADAGYRVARGERHALLQDGDLTRFYVKILHPAARAYEQVERVGWTVDYAYYMHLKDELQYELRELEKQGREIIGGRLVAKHMDENGNLNLTKASMLSDFMFGPTGLNLKPLQVTPKNRKPSTAMSHFMAFREHPKAKEFVEILGRYSEAFKAHNTYVVGFLEHLRSDGKFHPNYFLFRGNDFSDDDEDGGGANTGRLSVKAPAIQTIPKHMRRNRWAKKIRKAFCAPEGFLILSNDYQQGELRLTACIANEPTMISAYREGIDLHALTASAMAGYTWEDFLALKLTNPVLYEELRQLAKAGNFGLIYGMSVTGFVFYAASQYGVSLSYTEAEEKHSAFFRKYYRLPAWHKTYKEFAAKNRFVRSPLGRIRHLPMINSPESEIRSKEFRRAINAPVQSTLSDMSLWATARLYHYFGYRVPVFGMIHDQLLSYIPEDGYETYARQRKDIMENLPFKEIGWSPQLDFPVDSQIGRNLGELKDLKL